MKIPSTPKHSSYQSQKIIMILYYRPLQRWSRKQGTPSPMKSILTTCAFKVAKDSAYNAYSKSLSAWSITITIHKEGNSKMESINNFQCIVYNYQTKYEMTFNIKIYLCEIISIVGDIKYVIFYWCKRVTFCLASSKFFNVSNFFIMIYRKNSEKKDL